MTNYDYLSLNEFKERELEILELMAEGLSNAEIADKLYITKETVRWYNKQIYSKLGTSRRTEAIALAQKAGLIDAHGSATVVAILSDNLPLLSTPFVGRQKDIAELTALLAQPQSRLITIVGPGGMGKTRLAIEVAKRQLETFSSGVRYVALAPVDSADFTGTINPVVAMLADALGYPLREEDSPENQLLAYLQNKEMLIVFDNFEHLIETVDFLSNLCSQATKIKVLVTSRERLNLQEEWLFTLAGMAIPTDEKIKTSEALENSEVLTDYDAIQLFWQRARQGQPDFDLSAQQTEVIRICQLVEGLPPLFPQFSF